MNSDEQRLAVYSIVAAGVRTYEQMGFVDTCSELYSTFTLYIYRWSKLGHVGGRACLPEKLKVKL